MKRTLTAIAAGAVVVGASFIATNPTAPSLPDVQVPALQLSSVEGAQGMDPTALWLDLFTQASGNNPNAFGTNLPDSEAAALPGQIPLVVIDPHDPALDFEGILDGIAARGGSPLDAVTSALNGPGAVTYLIRNNGS